MYGLELLERTCCRNDVVARYGVLVESDLEYFLLCGDGYSDFRGAAQFDGDRLIEPGFG